MPMNDDSQTGHVDCFYQDKMIQTRKVCVSKNLSRLGLHVCVLVRIMDGWFLFDDALRRGCVANGYGWSLVIPVGLFHLMFRSHLYNELISFYLQPPPASGIDCQDSILSLRITPHICSSTRRVKTPAHKTLGMYSNNAIRLACRELSDCSPSINTDFAANSDTPTLVRLLTMGDLTRKFLGIMHGDFYINNYLLSF